MQSPSQNESGHSGAATGSPPSSASVLSASLSTDVPSTEFTSTTSSVTSVKRGTNVNAKPFQSMVTLNGTEASPGLGSGVQEDQQQPPTPSVTRLHSRKSSHASSPGGNTTVGGRMGDGIVNQNMKEDLENWISALGLSPEKPLKVVGCFGQTRDIVMAQRVTQTDCHPRSRRCRRQDLCRRRQHPLKGLEERQDKKIDESEGLETPTALIKDEIDQGIDVESEDSEGWDDDDDRLPVFFRGCRDTDSFILADAPLNDEFRTDDTTVEPSDAVGGMNEAKSSWMMGFGQQSKTGDIRAYIDRSKNQLLLQHTYLYDSQSMLSACLQSVEKTRGDRASLLKWMHDQEYESHRALLFLFLVSQVMVYTSPDMNIDPRMVSVLSALLTIKKQIMQEMDRFMTICWDRIGVLSPDQQRQNSDKNNDQDFSTGGGISGRTANSMANIFTPGKCVPVLVFVIERVQVSTPWHDPFASDQQVQDHLRQQVLKKSVDAIQTRLRYILRACRLIQTSDQPVGVFDARQLFVLPSPSSTPFVHVIPYFIGRLELPEREPASLEENQDHNTVLTGLDPAATMMNRQKTKGAGSSKRQHGPGGKNLREQRDKSRSNSDQQLQPQSHTQKLNPDNSDTFGMPGLRDLYDTITQAKDKPLGKVSAATSAGTATTVATGPKSRSNNSGTTSTGAGTATEDAASSTIRPISLGSLYADYSGPLLRHFVDGWVQNTTSVGGYGNVIGKRNAGTVEIPSLQQWVAGSLGVCEALGVTNLESPLVRSDNSINPNEVRYANRTRTSDQEDSGAILAMNRACQGLQQGLVHQQQHGSVSEDGTAGLRSAAKSSKRTGGSKKYSLRCANSVTRRIQEFVQSDEVMEELYGAQDQDPTQAASRAHSDRYRQLKADQAQKLFQSLAHRR